MYNWFGDRVERREWCKLVSPLGHRTQPLLSPASESSGPLRFQATRASTPDLDADCESCVVPDSPNLSIGVKTTFQLKQLLKIVYSPASHWQQQTVAAFEGLQCAMEAPPEAQELAKWQNVIAYLTSEHLWAQIGVLKCSQNVGGVCNELCTRDCTRSMRMGVVDSLGVRRDWIVRLGNAIGCGYDTEGHRKEETYGEGLKQLHRVPGYPVFSKYPNYPIASIRIR